jgi:hypothetical protein
VKVNQTLFALLAGAHGGVGSTGVVVVTTDCVVACVVSWVMRNGMLLAVGTAKQWTTPPVISLMTFNAPGVLDPVLTAIAELAFVAPNCTSKQTDA